MKKIIIGIAFIFLIGSIVELSCDSAAEKNKDAEAKVTKAQDKLSSAEAEAAASAKKLSAETEWNQFKAETELKIKKNDVRIAEIKASLSKANMKADKYYLNRIDSLENRNKMLKDKLSAYNAGQTDWEKFKNEFNRDMDGLGESLKNFAVPAKKK